MTDDADPAAVAETIDATSARESGTVASVPSPPVRAGRRSLLPVGTTVGRYVLAERIGAGGMGTVYRAHDPKLDRHVAVKLVSSSDLEASQQYLEREAQAMAKLSHPNVATVYDIGAWNEQLFIAMELCTGGSLAKWLVEPRPWREVVMRFVSAGAGLAAAHHAGLVHRDFKPDNVLLAGDGTVKVSDFGLVRSSAGAPTGSNPELIEGTPAYMAPEQLAGDDVDARADQFAFAVSVWEGVFGGRPFQPEVGTRDVVQGMLRAIRARRMMRSTTSEVPKRVVAILERGLAADPSARWPTLDAFVHALEVAATPRVWLRRGLLAAAVLALAIGATAAMMYVRQPTPNMPGMVQLVERSFGRAHEAAGDIALGQKRGAMAMPDHDDMTVAVIAFDAALTATGDREIRLKLARALRETDRCTQAVMQLDTYLREGGVASITDIGDVWRSSEQLPAPAIDMQYLVDMKRECEQIARLPSSPTDLQRLADSLWRTGDISGAVVALERAYIASKDPAYIQQIGDVLRNAGACEQAKQQYARYISLAKDVPQSWLDRVRGFGDQCQPAD